MKEMTRRTRLAALSGLCFACTVSVALMSLAPATALAQAMNGNQNRRGGMTSSLRMGSSGGIGASSQGSGIGRMPGSSGGGFGGISGGFGQRSSAGSMMGSPGGGGSRGLGGMAGSQAGASGSSSGSSGGKAPKLKLTAASGASAGSAPHSFYDYAYGADQIGRNADSLYKSPTDVPPTDNYRFGAADKQ
jgi:hypothetical protein